MPPLWLEAEHGDIPAHFVGRVDVKLVAPAKEGQPLKEFYRLQLPHRIWFDRHGQYSHKPVSGWQEAWYISAPLRVDPTAGLAFDEARRLIKEEFREGDRLLLATLGGWSQIYEGWIRDPEHALRAIDRLEVNPFVLAGRTEHLHHENWFDGLQTLILASGSRYRQDMPLFKMQRFGIITPDGDPAILTT